MKKYKATEKFNELGIDNSFQGLETFIFYELKRGKEVEIKHVPIKLLDEKYLQEVKIKEK